MISIFVNGQEESFSGVSLADLVLQLKLSTPHFAIAINRVVIPHSEFSKTLLQSKDQIEIVHAVGGG